MNGEDDWSTVLNDHPIFSLPKNLDEPSGEAKHFLELSSNTLPSFTDVDPTEDGPTLSGRRQVMILKDADLILAAGKEIRITSLGESKLNRSTTKSYKTLHTPNIQFEIQQLVLNPSGKLLAVAGAFQVTVVVLPRSGFMRLVPATIDCKSIQVGQFYHASRASPPIAKIEWHPWGEGGSTLMVMTVDGKLREYDISLDTEEPQQVLSFVSERRTKSFLAEDVSEREVASFTLGKGKADWGPLTVYVVMKSGDVYAICPYMPKNASIPSSYVHTLECFISAKKEFLSQGSSTATKNLSTLYDYQHKYINALLKQLPSGTVFPAASRSVPMHPPATIKAQPVRQGPFLLQPSPRTLEGSEGGDATDVVYLTFGSDYEEDGEGETERLGVIMIAFRDGKIDVCLDVEKVEARWEIKQERSHDLPMLAVYETIDLGLVSMLNQSSTPFSGSPLLDLLQGNHPLLFPDPIHDDTIYVYHAFGVHTLILGPLLQSLALVLREDDDAEGNSLIATLQTSNGTNVHPILNTFSIERKCSNPVVAVAVSDDVYLTYSIFILTSTMRITSFTLNLRSEVLRLSPHKILPNNDETGSEEWLVPTAGPPGYISLLGNEPYAPAAVLSRPMGLPSNPRLVVPGSESSNKSEFVLTPDTLRYLGKTVEHFTSQIREIQLAHTACGVRSALQKQEFIRQQDKYGEIAELIEKLKGSRYNASQGKLTRIQTVQKVLLARLDRILQALMEKASPELSENETKWFEELKRLKQEVTGTGRYDEGSLVARTKLLEKEYARILPNLKVMFEKEIERKEKLRESNKGLGFSQAFEFGERSNTERARIRQIEKEILKLASRLDIPLGRPPSRQ